MCTAITKLMHCAARPLIIWNIILIAYQVYQSAGDCSQTRFPLTRVCQTLLVHVLRSCWHLAVFWCRQRVFYLAYAKRLIWFLLILRTLLMELPSLESVLMDEVITALNHERWALFRESAPEKQRKSRFKRNLARAWACDGLPESKTRFKSQV